MKWYRYLAVVVLSVVSLEALALTAGASAQSCATMDDLTEQIRQGIPNAEITRITGEAAARVRAGISSLVGQQVPEGGTYLIAAGPGALTDYIVRFVGGCATHHGRFPDRLVRAWLDGSPT